MDKRKLKRKRPESEETNSATGSDSSASGDTVILADQSDEDPAALVEVGDGEADVDESGGGSECDILEDASAEPVVETSTRENTKVQDRFQFIYIHFYAVFSACMGNGP